MKKLEFKINKEIYALRLSVTTSCPLRCRYCFVKKTNKLMDLETAKKSIDLLLSSPGNKKLLMIYGGEPLLHPYLEEIILSALDKAKDLKKELDISLATNGLLLDKDFLSFFKKERVKISISIDGNKKAHDQNRVFIDGAGAFNLISKKLPLIFRFLDQSQIAAIMTVAPNLSNKMFKNFFYLIKRGFKNIHLEPVQGTSWNNKQKISFCSDLKKIIKYLLENIENKKFVFLSFLNRFLFRRSTLEGSFNCCPFYSCLEIYPQGEISFSPFLLNLSEPEKEKYIVGNARKGFIKKYQNCRFEQMSYQCQNCWSAYYPDINERKNTGAQLVNWRNQLCQRVADYIYQRSLNNKNFKKYIQEAKKRIFE
jgi:sulfatase maturation enzyme AslB (radical SAM superfamily)